MTQVEKKGNGKQDRIFFVSPNLTEELSYQSRTSKKDSRHDQVVES